MGCRHGSGKYYNLSFIYKVFYCFVLGANPVAGKYVVEDGLLPSGFAALFSILLDPTDLTV